jgi:glycosyltransferase involved in cell wall biosynthesis
MKQKLCYVISDVDTSLLIDGNVRHLDQDRYDLTVVFLAPQEPGLFKALLRDGYNVRFIKCSGKIDLPRVTYELYRLFRSTKPEIIHTHLFHAAMSGLTAGMFAGVRSRVNTRHHSIEAHLYHPHAVWYDRYLNKISTHIVAITDRVARILIDTEGVPSSKITVVHHGFDLTRFDAALREPADLRLKYGLEKNAPVVGVISRFIHWKGIQFISPAFERLLSEFPNAKLVLSNATGGYGTEIRRLLSRLPETSFCLIPFEEDVLSLYKSFDLFVHVPIGPDYEAFGQVYVEALAMQRPSIFTLSGIANDFITDGHNAIVVPYEDTDAIHKAMVKLVSDPGLARQLAIAGHSSIKDKFGVEKMVNGLEKVYKRLDNGTVPVANAN